MGIWKRKRAGSKWRPLLEVEQKTCGVQSIKVLELMMVLGGATLDAALEIA